MTNEERAALVARLRIYIRTTETAIKAGLASEEDRFNLEVRKIALASLEAPVLGYIHKHAWHEYKQAVCSGYDDAMIAYESAQSHFPVYTAPPVAVMQPVVLPVMQVDNPLDGFFYRCDEVIAAIRAAGGSVKE